MRRSWLCSTLPSAARVISSVSPRDDVVSIGPVLPDDLGALFVWLNDAGTAVTDMAVSADRLHRLKDWLDQQSEHSQQLLFSVRTLEPPRLVGFVIFKNLQPVTRAAELGVRIGIETDRGRGFGTRATRLALDYAWKDAQPPSRQPDGFRRQCRAPSPPIAGPASRKKA